MADNFGLWPQSEKTADVLLSAPIVKLTAYVELESAIRAGAELA
jgi:hypothetical protein